MKSILLLILLCSTPFVSLAGGADIVGNGGGVRVCRSTDGFLNIIEPFDFAENRYLRRMKQDEPLTQLGTVDAVINTVLSRLKKYSPERAQRLMNLSSLFSSRILYAQGPLPIPSDISGFFNLTTCEYRTISIQFKDQKRGYYYYTIDANLWLKMNPYSKAGIIMHELLFQETLDRGGTNSRWARHLNAVIFSDSMKWMDRWSFYRILIEAQYPLEWGGVFWEATSVQNYVVLLPQKKIAGTIVLEDVDRKLAKAKTALNASDLQEYGFSSEILFKLKQVDAFIILDSRLNILKIHGEVK